MSVELDPIIAQKLEDFRRRRRNLIFLRGVVALSLTMRVRPIRSCIGLRQVIFLILISFYLCMALLKK